MPSSFTLFPARTVLRLEGRDAAPFLQNLISNDIHLLKTQAALYACLLSPQGKFLFDFIIVQEKDSYLLDSEAARADDLVKTLMLYRLRSAVQVALDPTWSVGFSTARPDQSLPHAFEDPRNARLGWRILTQEPLAEDAARLTQWDTQRILLGVPDGSRDAQIGVSTLEDLNITHINGVSFTKGCYVGQELTARMHHRGLGKKHLTPVLFEDRAPTDRPDILRGDTVVGHVRSTCGPYALAIIKDDALAGPLTCLGRPLRLVP